MNIVFVNDYESGPEAAAENLHRAIVKTVTRRRLPAIFDDVDGVLG